MCNSFLKRKATAQYVFFFSLTGKTRQLQNSGDRRRKSRIIKAIPSKHASRNVLFQKRHVEGRRGSGREMGNRSTKDRL